MKCAAVLLGVIAGLCVVPSLALNCLECSDAKNERECKETGKVRACRFNENACEIELREHHGWGGGYRYFKHCKQSWACSNNHIQNPRAAWDPTQCNANNINSVCRCCCYTDECNVAQEDCFGAPSCPALPTSIPYGTITCTNGSSTGSACTVTCDNSAMIQGVPTTYCRYDGAWSYPVARCQALQCDARITMPNGWFICSNGLAVGSQCIAYCRPGYTRTGARVSTCRRYGNGVQWTYPPPYCAALQCPERGEVNDGMVNCTDGRNLWSRCSAVCLGNTRLIGIAHSYCQDNGEWSHELPTCELIQCPLRGMILHGFVDCSAGIDVNSICFVTCDDGYAVVGDTQSSCQPTGFWSAPLARCERIQCPHRKPTGYMVMHFKEMCTNDRFVGSICTVVCDDNWLVGGLAPSECLPDGTWDSEQATCTKVQCPNRGEVVGGIVSCSNKAEVGSVCVARCNIGSQSSGDPRSVCLESGDWSNPLPSCLGVSCPVLDFYENGVMTCTGNDYGAECTFICDEGYRRLGTPRVTCRMNGKWSSRVPECRAYAVRPPPTRPPPETAVLPAGIDCPAQTFLRHGSVSCTRDYVPLSTCTFQCDGDYELFPQGLSTNVCERSGRWNIRKPCCTKPCPPYAEVDMILVLDSSSSVGADNWILLTDFVKNLIRSFTVSPEAANFAVFRFNKVVDTSTQILLKDFPDNRDGLITAFNLIPYDGSGTFTGGALQHAFDVSMKEENGNRPDVPDLVFVITDGKAADDVAAPSQKIRDTGATILVLGIEPPRGKLDVGQLNEIAGVPENLVIAEGGFAGLDEEFTAKLSSLVCTNRCVR